MPALLHMRPSRARSALFSLGPLVCVASCVSLLSGCGEITCPEPLSAIDGTCQKLEPEPEGDQQPESEPEPGAQSEERCDGIDNDNDDAVDEDWPALGKPCGARAGVGECLAGEYVCAADGRGILCEGAVEPTAEACDGKDNDCDGLVDEGALVFKNEVFGDYAAVAAVEGGFVVTRIISDQVRVETYDTRGNRTGHHDDVGKPVAQVSFLESDAAQGRVLVALGKHTFHVLDVDVDAALVPIVVGASGLHQAWRQGIDFGVYDPPYHPRVTALPSRFVGYANLIDFAFNGIAQDSLAGLGDEPSIVVQVAPYAPFDAAGPYVVWQSSGNVRAGWLLDDGRLNLVIDVDRGGTPAINLGNGGPGLAYLQSGRLRLSELGGFSLQCAPGGFCHAALESEALADEQVGPTALAYDGSTDSWFVAAGSELMRVARGEDGPVVTQVEVLDALGETPQRVDVAVSGGAAALVQTSERGASTLSFVGCL